MWWERRDAYWVLVGNLRERPRRRWEHVTQMDLHEVGLGSIDLTEMAQDRDSWPALVNAIIKFLVP